MSQYIHFFIKTKDDIYYPIGTFNRSDIRYKLFSNRAPYESVDNLTKRELKEIINEAKEEIELNTQRIEEEKVKLEWLKGAQMDLDDKLDIVEEYFSAINERENNIKEINKGIDFVYYLMSLISEAYNDNHYSSEESRMWLHEDFYVYFGIECGNPNVVYDKWGEVIENRVTGYKKEASE